MMRFYGGRFSILKIENNIFYENGNEKRFNYVVEILSKDAEFSNNRMNLMIKPIFNKQGQLIGGKIGKETDTKLALRKMEKIPTKLYPYVTFIINSKEQIILIEKNTTVFSNPLSVFKYFISYVNEQLFDKGIEVDIKPLTFKGGFWKLISELESIYSVQFRLKAPNFLGDSYRDLKEILDKEKDDVNANEIQLGVANDSGKLKIIDNNKYNAAIGWVEDGGGEWFVQGKEKGNGKGKKTYKNSNQLQVFDIDYTIETHNSASLEEVQSQIDLGPYKKKD